MKKFSIGVISDTHGLLRPEVLHALAGVDHVLHAGDVGDPAILVALRQVAPLTAIRGNIDTHGACSSLPATEAVELAGKLFYLIHDLKDLDLKPEAARIDAIVSGHSHKHAARTAHGVLYLNPGSAGPVRFRLPITLALLQVLGDEISPRIVDLSPRSDAAS